MKIFGIGLPRTGTTSLAIAMLELGYKTAHVCFSDSVYERGEAFFDTPVYADYPMLDHRYPGSKFILSWRDPKVWHRSFHRNLGGYLKQLRTTDAYKNGLRDALNWRCYSQVFGLADIADEDYMIGCYQRHREQVEFYFRNRPKDLLILNMTPHMGWDELCDFLGRPMPVTVLPQANTGITVGEWDELRHPNKI